MRKLLTCLLICLMITGRALADMTVHFLDVGHGDCSILLCDGEAMIVDGGTSGKSDMIFAYLRQQGIQELKYAIATHPDADHIGGLPAAFHAAQVDVLYTPVLEDDRERFAILMETATAKGADICVPEVGEKLLLGGATVTILSPDQEYSESNDMSIVLRVDFGSTSFLFCGDAGVRIEKHLMESGADLAADVLRVGHHGSDTSTSETFVQTVKPTYAIISCSERYDNPDAAVVERLQDHGATLLCTKQLGTIILHSDGACVTVQNTLRYIADRKLRMFHRPDCPIARRSPEADLYKIYSGVEAEVKSLRPCPRCRP